MLYWIFLVACVLYVEAPIFMISGKGIAPPSHDRGAARRVTPSDILREFLLRRCHDNDCTANNWCLVLQFNFVGKLLGPKGNSLKRLQEETMTKMAILGRGSMRDKQKVSNQEAYKSRYQVHLKLCVIAMLAVSNMVKHAKGSSNTNLLYKFNTNIYGFIMWLCVCFLNVSFHRFKKPTNVHKYMFFYVWMHYKSM